MTGSLTPLYASMATSSISSIGTAFSQSRALSANGSVQQSIADSNAKIANLQADEVVSDANVTASRTAARARQVSGTVKANQGGSGVDVNSGSPLATRLGIDSASEIDEMTIRNNAARKAWGIKTQAMEDTYQGKVASMTAKNEAEQTLLSGGINAVSGPLGIYANYSKWSRSARGGTEEDLPFGKV